MGWLAPTTVLATAAAVLAAVGLVQALAGGLAAFRFARRRPAALGPTPPITLLKPLHGAEPMLEEALESACRQDYPQWQIVCGVASAEDPAVAVVERLRARYPACDIALVIDPTPHGVNGKIGNLINMLPAAKHDLLAISDSDVHTPPDYLTAVAAAASAPGVGLVTAVYAGLAAPVTLASRLGATAITHLFLPGALLARALGRQDCLGATMALRRTTLAAIGGLESLADRLADDNLLGRKVRALGLSVGLAPVMVSTTVPEETLSALWRHELRWSRTIRRLEPAGFAASSVQYPLAWALLTLILSGGADWAVAGFLVAWVLRAALALAIDARLGLAKSGLATRAPIWLLPVRDALSLAVFAASYASDRVEWRGRNMRTALDKSAVNATSGNARAHPAPASDPAPLP